MNHPDAHSPIDPPEVDDITAKLSALLDGELEGSELIDIEQHAVDNETTIAELSAGLAASKAAVSELTDQPISAASRSRHIGAALDAMDAPEVKSLAAARAGRRSDDPARTARAQRLNDRLRRLTAVAAVVAVIGGVGLLSVQGGLGGSDDDEAATAGDVSAEAAAPLERNADLASSDGGASDDGSSSDDAMASDDGSAEDALDSAQSGPGPLDLNESGPLEPIAVSDTLNLADATLLDLPDEVLERSSILSGATGPVNEALCFGAAAELVPEGDIVEGITIEQGGREFELVVLANEELLVFELPQCAQVD